MCHLWSNEEHADKYCQIKTKRKGTKKKCSTGEKIIKLINSKFEKILVKTNLGVQNNQAS